MAASIGLSGQMEQGSNSTHSTDQPFVLHQSTWSLELHFSFIK